MILYPVIDSDDLDVFDMTGIIFFGEIVFNGVVGVLTAASWWCCFGVVLLFTTYTSVFSVLTS